MHSKNEVELSFDARSVNEGFARMAVAEFITELKEGSMEPKVLEINGNTYCNKNLTRYHYFPKADSLSVNTLTSIVDYIKGKPEELRESMILHVISPTEVRLYSGLVDERNREELMRADAIVNEFQFDRYYDQERFLIELQANFIESDDLTVLKQVAGNIQSGTTANYDDDGVSQKTTIKSGIANKTDRTESGEAQTVSYLCRNRAATEQLCIPDPGQ